MRALTKLLIAVSLGALPLQGLQASEFSGRYAMLGSTAQAKPGDWGYEGADNTLLGSDQQGLRLMWEEGSEKDEWTLHLRATRSQVQGISVETRHSSALFRYEPLAHTFMEEADDTSATRLRYEVDRLNYRRPLGDITLGLGRQAIEWGSGRFWQPLNLFGSFSPTDLDTDYKPGIDTFTLDYYPSPFAAMTAVYAFAPHDDTELSDSGAVHYRRQVGTLSELTLAAGSILGNTAIGAAFESVWGDIGWRLEGTYYDLSEFNDETLFWIAGLDYQFDDGTLLSVEYYNNSRGITSEQGMRQAVDDPLLIAGLQQHAARQLLGVGLSRDLTPLLQGSYTLLLSQLEDAAGGSAYSQLQQLQLTYSVSNESDLLAALLLPAGKGLNANDEPRSEFGHLPASLSLRLRFYF